MNRDEFLQQLAHELAPLSEAERRRVVDYYREMICDGVENGEDERKLIESFGRPQEIAAQILAESRSTVPSVPEDRRNIYTAKGPVQGVAVDAQQAFVRIRPVPSGPVQAEYDSPDRSDRVGAEEAGGVFTFRQTVQTGLFHWHSIFMGPRRIILNVPASFCGTLRVVTGNAGIGASDLGRLEHMSVESSNGAVNLENTECGTLEVKTSNGSVTLRNLRGGTCTARTSNGHITAETCTFPDALTLRTSNGGISVQGLRSGRFDFTSSNGSVRGTLVGDMRDYAIHSHTSNGSSTLPTEVAYPDQTKSLSVHTNNARISVKFVSDHP